MGVTLAMPIKDKMIHIKSNCFMFLVIMLCSSMVGSLEDRQITGEVYLSQLVNLVTGEVDEGVAELLWISCRLDLLCLKKADKDLDFCFPEETFGMAGECNSARRSLVKKNTWKIIKVQHPKLKQTLLDCMKRNNNLLHVGKGDSNIQHTRYLDSFFPKVAVKRRNLLQTNADSPAPVVGSPFPSPAPSPDSAPSPVPTASDPPIPSPLSPPVSAPASPPVSTPKNSLPSPQTPFFPIGDGSPPPAIKDASADPTSGPNVEANSSKSNHKVIIVAVVVTAILTSAIAGLICFCCPKIFRKGSGLGRNDESRLLNLSLSDYSTGSYKFFGLVNSAEGEKVGHQSFNMNSNYDNPSLHSIKSDVLSTPAEENTSFGGVGATGVSSESIDKSSNSIGLLPLPPGRANIMPPLKPPPRRATPLPPEPPAALRPLPPIKAGSTPPPPLPPRAPTPPAKASGSADLRPPVPPPPGPPPPRPVAHDAKLGPSPPPPPPKTSMAPRPPPPLPGGSKVPHPPFGSKLPSNSTSGEGDGMEGNSSTTKAKLKPFFWDKVMANPDHSMVWHQLKTGSFQFNEEMIETLFGYAPADRKADRRKDSSSEDPSSQNIQILDTKKAQNLAILLRALNVTIEEISDALHEGNELPVELLEILLKMPPTAGEELKLRLFNGEISQLGPAERFLKVLVDIPFAYKRLEALLFMCTLQEDVNTTKECFETLEVACKELKSSRLFLKLLEAVLKTGNRMNDGTFRGGAQAFKLDTLLKLSDVKGVDGKTTLLHFVVQEISRSEGVKAARTAREGHKNSNISDTNENVFEDIPLDTEDDYRSLGLQVVSRLSSELENVKKAAAVDADSITGTVAKLGNSLLRAQDLLTKDLKNLEGESKFYQVLKNFVQNAEVDVMSLLSEEERIMALVKSTGDYFHGKAGKDEGLRLFVIVRDFLIILDKVCKQVAEAQKITEKTPKKGSSSRQQLSPDFRTQLFPAIQERKMVNSSSDDDSE
ncbi:hypothetical protein JCGZ_00795 [Jatropha curcas]|uniref:Formin-like protein n=1 Tax=Jatropha curcas TaxID=180498 RepID=A0A067KVL0_JATCU|nr:formin-like protein 5 [Jatropha curcas]KDP39038.1 hypothetical protein JCGZ_00795 [Jatropha curcas]